MTLLPSPGRDSAAARWLALLLILTPWARSQAQSVLVAYEGFDYPAGSLLSGQSGGSGWSNAWVDVSGNAGETVGSAGLVAGNSAPVGFDNRSSGNSVYVGNGSRCGRWLDCSATGVFA